MKNTLSDLRPTRRIAVVSLLAVVMFGTWLCTPSVHSQAPAAAPAANPAIDALLVKLKTQQDTMVANQTKIEAQTALLKENLRQAKIYAARGGGHR